jgi:S1-C subfamily serine protease
VASPWSTPTRWCFRRDGAILEKTVILSKLRISGEVIATNRPLTWRGLRVDFVSTIPNVNFGDEIIKAMAQGGVIISEVQSGSSVAGVGLKPGQIIVKVDGKSVRTPADFAKAVEGITGTVTITTEGERTYQIR